MAVTVWWYSVVETTTFALPCIEFWFTHAETLPIAEGVCREADPDGSSDSACAAFVTPSYGRENVVSDE